MSRPQSSTGAHLPEFVSDGPYIMEFDPVSPTNLTTSPPPMVRLPLWLRRIGIAPPLLLIAFALPAPQHDKIAGFPSMCMFHIATGLPCPGCGMTRAVVCCAHGLWAQGVRYHPLGPLIFFMMVAFTVFHVLQQFRPAWRLRVPPALIYGLAYTTFLGLGGIWIARLSGLLPSPP